MSELAVTFFVNPIDEEVLVYDGDELIETMTLEEFEQRRIDESIRVGAPQEIMR